MATIGDESNYKSESNGATCTDCTDLWQKVGLNYIYLFHTESTHIDKSYINSNKIIHRINGNYRLLSEWPQRSSDICFQKCFFRGGGIKKLYFFKTNIAKLMPQFREQSI